MAARPDRVGYQGKLGIPWLNRGTSQPPINLCRCGQELSKIGLGTSHHPKPETIFSKVGIGLAKNSDRLDSIVCFFPILPECMCLDSKVTSVNQTGRTCRKTIKPGTKRTISAGIMIVQFALKCLQLLSQRDIYNKAK